MSSKAYTKVLDFWFGPKGSPGYLEAKHFWYGSKRSDDEYVEKHLGKDYEDAKTGQLDNWRELGEGEGALALVILLDQVPRNIFRDTPKAYATDSYALEVAKYAVLEKGWDKTFPDIQRRYLYSPFNHSEDVKDQEESLRLFTELGDEFHLHWARNYYDQIKKNGRFIHRDPILGRK
jgi:uncharacterized protein (DUF924 family)